MDYDKEDDGKSREDKIIDQAKERFKLAEDAEQKIREEALDDLKFRKGEQWPLDISDHRRRNKRPTLIINKMPQFIRQVTNDQKQNRPAIKVNPVDDNSDKETAKILQGLIRNIENVSDAEEAYDRAFESAATCSFGFFRVFSEYAGPDSFEQEARIGMIENPFNVYLDPYAMKIDGSDAEWGFIVDTLTHEEFRNKYGESKLAKEGEWEHYADQHKGWVSRDEIRIAEYYYKEYKKCKLYRLQSGETVFSDDVDIQETEDGVKFVETNEGPDWVTDERDTEKTIVKWCKITAADILEETEWPSQYIPIIPVYGEVLNVDGEVVRESLIRHSKDSQRMVNYWASSEAEAITLAPKAPFIGYEGQFEGHEHTWANANFNNEPFLEVKPMSLEDGSIAPLPQRNAYEPPVMALTQARALANQDVKETTGVPDAARGMAAEEQSGIAIQRRVNQGLTANFHLVDNLNKAIKQAGRILVEIIPKLYDTERIVRILGEQDEEQIIRINAFDNFAEDQDRPYDFTYGKYDVSVATGPNFETKRQEARDGMLQMMQFNPQFAQVASDILVKQMDFPGAEEMSERIKKTMDPAILDEGNKDLPPEAMAQIQQANQMVEQLQAELQQATEIIKTDQLRLESAERIAQMKVEADLAKESMRTERDANSQVLKRQLELEDRKLDEMGYGDPEIDSPL